MLLATLSAVLIPFMFFATIVAIVLGSLYYSNQARIRKYKLIEQMIAQGQNVTPELLDSLGKNIEPAGKETRTPFGHAVYLVLIGAGLAVFFWAMYFCENTPGFLIAVGIFPFVTGVSRLIAILYEKRPSN